MAIPEETAADPVRETELDLVVGNFNFFSDVLYGNPFIFIFLLIKREISAQHLRKRNH